MNTKPKQIARRHGIVLANQLFHQSIFQAAMQGGLLRIVDEILLLVRVKVVPFSRSQSRFGNAQMF